MPDRPKYIRFNKFLSEQPDRAEQEAIRLRQLKAELARIKKQRLAFIAITLAAVTTITVLSIQLLNHGTSKIQTPPRIQPGEGSRAIRG